MKATFIPNQKNLLQLIKMAVREVLLQEATNLLQKERDNEFLTSSALCRMYSISRPTLASLQKRGVIKVYKLGGKNFYKKSEIDEAIQNSRSQYERN